MWSFILFAVIAAWIVYDFFAVRRYVEDYGYDTWGVAVTFFLGAPIDLIKWVASKF